MRYNNQIDIGRLRHRVAIIKYQDEENELGEITKSKVVYKKVWAEVQNKTGKEIDNNGKIVNIDYKRIKIRYCKDIDTTMMIRFGDVDYYITSIDNYNNLNKEIILEVIDNRT